MKIIDINDNKIIKSDDLLKSNTKNQKKETILKIKSHDDVSELPDLILKKEYDSHRKNELLARNIANISNRNINNQESVMNENILDDQLLQIENNDINQINSKTKIVNFIFSLGLGVGMAFANMPIFTNEAESLKDIGIDIHQTKTGWYIETINTALITGAVTFSTSYYMLNKHKILQQNPFKKIINFIHESPNTKKKIQKAIELTVSFGQGSFINGLLWNVELNNKIYAESTGFDEYIGYAVGCTIPIFIAKALITYDAIEKEKYYISSKHDLDKRKITAISLSILASVGRFFGYTYTASEFCKLLGVNEDISDIIGTIVGGIIANTASAIKSYYETNHIFRAKCDSLNRCEFILSLASSVEGIWFSLPTITASDRAMKEYNFNDALRYTILAPLGISTIISESKDIFESYINLKESMK